MSPLRSLANVLTLLALLPCWNIHCLADEDRGAEAASAKRAKMVRRIDELVHEQLAKAKLTPAASSTDAEFVRRVYLDFTGAIPRVADVREFLADTRADKRPRLIDRLLESPAHATHLANTWRNIMLPGGVNNEQITSVVGVQNWLRSRFAENVRYDNLVSELLVATEGDDLGPALYYTSLDLAPEKLAASTARIFLGLQMECAQCHDHPFDKWKQADFWGYAAFFAQLQRPENGPAATGGPPRLVDLDRGDVRLPNSETVVAPRFPGGKSPAAGEAGARRVKLAIWMASRDNPYLARAGVNRIWALLFGRGLVEPVDDLGPHNAASHPELLAELADYFVHSGFDVRELFRTLANTQTYQRTSAGNEAAAPPELYARRSVKTLSAEQLYDSLQRVLARPSPAMFPGANSTNPLLDPRRQAFVAQMQSQSRSPLDYQAGILQALTQMNGSEVSAATDPQQGTLLGALEAPLFADGGRVETLFLATLSRPPTVAEREKFEEHLAKAKPGEKQKALGDLLWALLNCAEFALNH